jgi:predicted acetyltransferase
LQIAQLIINFILLFRLPLKHMSIMCDTWYFQIFILGKHKDHNVKLIKKALGEVKGDYL